MTLPPAFRAGRSLNVTSSPRSTTQLKAALPNRLTWIALPCTVGNMLVRFRQALASKRARMVALVVVAVLLLVVLDWWQRNREMGQLLDAVEHSEKAMNTVAHSFESVKINTLVAEACRLSLQDSRCQTGQAEFENQVESKASEGAAAIRTDGAEVGHVGVFPWHGALKEARSAYVDHNDAWVTFYKQVAANGFESKSNSVDIDATFRIAENRFRDAVPVWARFNVPARIDKAWAE